jgi:hypothetical protein
MNYKSHFDIASVIHKDDIISSSYKYDENSSKWFFKGYGNEWIEDNKEKRIKEEIKTRIFDKFIKKYEKTNEKKDEISYYNSIFYLEIAMNLKKDKYIKKILNELKQFY